MPDEDILLKLLDIYHSSRLHNENMARGSLALVTAASVVLWSNAFNRQVPMGGQIVQLVVSLILPIFGYLFSHKMERANRQLIVLSNRIRDKHLKIDEKYYLNQPCDSQVILKDWRQYNIEDFRMSKGHTLWQMERWGYTILCFIGACLILYASVRFGLWSTICSLPRF